MPEATNINSFETSILAELYKDFTDGKQLVPLSELPGGGEPLSEVFLRALRHLSDSNLASGVTNDSYRITWLGVLYCEEHDIGGKELVQSNRKIRANILDALAALHKEYGGSQNLPHVTLADKINEDIYVVLNNVDILEHGGLIEGYALGLHITDRGLAYIAEREAQAELTAKYEHIALMVPQKRGVELQHLFAAIAKRSGWIEEESVRSSNEEMDVIIHRGLDYFLVECKWEKDPSQAEVIEKLYGKLAKRAGANGLVLSLTGFTRGAEKATVEHMGDRIILLFGLKDFESMVYDAASLNDKLEAKQHALITKRSVLVE